MAYLTDSPYLIYGDFNHDGRQDAAVIISQSQNGSAENQTLAFLIHDGTKLVHQQSAGLADRAVVRSLRERDSKVFIDMFVHQSGDCMAGPTKHVQYVYAYTGQGQWVEGTLVNILPSRRLRAS